MSCIPFGGQADSIPVHVSWFCSWPVLYAALGNTLRLLSGYTLCIGYDYPSHPEASSIYFRGILAQPFPYPPSSACCFTGWVGEDVCTDSFGIFLPSIAHSFDSREPDILPAVPRALSCLSVPVIPLPLTYWSAAYCLPRLPAHSLVAWAGSPVPG